jgi:preprotein translocase subunit SecG
VHIFYSAVLYLGLVISAIFTALVLITGKGDAMSGGGSVRTTFKGKASFDDIMSKWTLYTGITLMGLVLLTDVLVKFDIKK